MKLEGITTFLTTMSEYNNVNIVQTFTTERGKSLSVKCLPGTETFVITDVEKALVTHIETIDDAAAFIFEYIEMQMFNV